MSSVFSYSLIIFGALILGRLIIFIHKNPSHFDLFVGVLSSNQGSVRICNQGAYVAKCGLNSRTADGRTRSYETGKFLAGQCSTLELPFEAIWGEVWCDNYVFIAATKRIFREEFNAPSVRCYQITGTTIHPGMSGPHC
ncbi:unnamed protein product [Rotaria sp. Silwood2]|nr:unnamed protein product [Rotaria sp. Silwood2]CAF2676745.1 unnamed protein product [Rotaria sp. Silwood2]CAF2940016.1 unnamed protein product [Rotaria sp. Silwood2]CAF3101757.1 unnamed protein product [Rotaria sp. Silwood2]CAF4010552.1 unnamed protein product [Rotaria sp. Silwood2]